MPKQKATSSGPSDLRNERPLSLFGPLQALLIPESLHFEDPKDFGRALAAWVYQLSRDDVLLLEHLALGLTNAEIAERMGVAEENTIKNRIKTLFKKLGVSNRVQAAQIAPLYGFSPTRAGQENDTNE